MPANPNPINHARLEEIEAHLRRLAVHIDSGNELAAVAVLRDAFRALQVEHTRQPVDKVPISELRLGVRQQNLLEQIDVLTIGDWFSVPLAKVLSTPHVAANSLDVIRRQIHHYCLARIAQAESDGRKNG